EAGRDQVLIAVRATNKTAVPGISEARYAMATEKGASAGSKYRRFGRIASNMNDADTAIPSSARGARRLISIVAGTSNRKYIETRSFRSALHRNATSGTLLHMDFFSDAQGNAAAVH